MIADNEILAAALLGYKAELAKLEQRITDIRARLSVKSPGRPRREAPTEGITPASASAKRKVSAATRKRMAAAQQKRWAAKSADAPEIAPKVEIATKKTAGKRAPLSPEAGERIAAAQRKRWAKAKKAAKTRRFSGQ
jgi:hypothetical protein